MNAPTMAGATNWKMEKAYDYAGTHPTAKQVGDMLRGQTVHDEYIEAQVHGGVTVKDFEKVVFHGKAPSPAIIEKLDKYGIAWEHVGDEK